MKRTVPALCLVAPALLLAPAFLLAGAHAAFRGSADVVAAEPLLSVDRLHAGAEAEAAVVVRVEPGWHVNAHKPSLEYLIPTRLEVSAPAGLRVSEPSYPEPITRHFEFAGSALAVYEGESAIRFRVGAAPGAAPGARRIEGTLTVQACSDNLCLAPSKLPVALEVEVADLSAPVAPRHPRWFEHGAGAVGATGGGGASAGAGGGPASGTGSEIAGLLARQGWLLTLGSIFLSGLLLNLTPCVYPLIPITVSYFGAQASERSLPRPLLALLYVAGLAITYSALGVAAALTGSILGASLQSPWVLGGIAALMVALALSLFGLYEVRLPSALTSRLGSRRGAFGALFMGLTIGLVAAPCVGPFVIPLLAYVGAAGDPWKGFWMFMSLSLGLGAPYLVLAMGASSISRLPRAGEWMVGVKRLFGLALLAMAAYFASPLLPKSVSPWVLPAALLLIAAHLVLFERAAEQVRGFRILRLACAAAALGLAALVGWPAPPGVAFEPYSAEAVARARSEGRPVIIDFYADWCLPCRELDRITFRHPRVVEAAGRFVALKADVTRFGAPEVEALRRQYDILGVPTVLFLDPAGSEPRHLRVTGYLGPSAFHERMQEVLAAGRAPEAQAAAGGS